MSGLSELFGKIVYAGLIIGFTAIAAKIIWERLTEKTPEKKKQEEDGKKTTLNNTRTR